MGNSTPTPSSKRPQSIEEFEIKYEKACRSSHSQKRLKEGICHGMCLDWVRSMIHDSGARFIEYHSMGIGELRKVYSVEERIHNVFNIVGDNLIKRDIEEQNDLIATAERKHEKAVRLQRHGMQLLSSIESSELRLEENLTSSERNQLIVDVRSMDRDIEIVNRFVHESTVFARSVERRVERLKRRIHDDEVMFHHFFSYFREHFHEWIQEGEDFRDIVAGEGVYHTVDPKTLDEWFTKIRTCLFQLESNKCALLNFRRSSDDPKDPGGGHYFAFARMGSAYHLFDPNVGWYSVEGLSEVMEMFKDLWSAGYVKENYRKSIWRVFYSAHQLQIDPRLPLGHAIL